MKGNIKNLVLFVIVAAMFITATMASAGPKEKFIHAEYVFTGSGGCLLAPGGFDASLKATGTTTLGPNVWAGVYTFERDGTGTVTAVNRAINSGSASAAEMSWAFDYTIVNGDITFKNMRDFEAVYTDGPNAGHTSYLKWTVEYYGVISADGKIINVSYGAPMIHYVLDAKNGNIVVGPQIICQVAVTGFRQ